MNLIFFQISIIVILLINIINCEDEMQLPSSMAIKTPVRPEEQMQSPLSILMKIPVEAKLQEPKMVAFTPIDLEQKSPSQMETQIPNIITATQLPVINPAVITRIKDDLKHTIVHSVNIPPPKIATSMDTASKEFHRIAKETYDKVLPCIKSTPTMKNKDVSNLKFPLDAEQHYKEILIQTKVMRNVPIHKAAGYGGPWIEDYFIDYFINQPLSYFNGFIPLFIQWTDIHCLDFEPKKSKAIPLFKDLNSLLKQILRPDVLYLLVTQDDQGMTMKGHHENPNVLSLSAGGYGHIPIPLIKGELNYSNPLSADKYTHEIGFYGNVRPRLSRSRMLTEMQQSSHRIGLKTEFKTTHNWDEVIKNTKYNLAPRGFGRTSYRLSEIVQLGRLPVYMYDDFQWLPYEGSDAHISNFGYIGKMGQTKDLAKKLKETNNDDYDKKISKIKDIRYYYTYEGVINQIEKFISDPFSSTNGGKFKCFPYHLLKDHRRLSNSSINDEFER
jgi:hypothetical protein